MVRYNKYVSSVFFIFGFDSICPINSLTFSKLFEWQNHSIFYCRNLSIQVIKNYLYYFSAFSINKHSSSVSAHFLLIAKNRNGYFRYTPIALVVDIAVAKCTITYIIVKRRQTYNIRTNEIFSKNRNKKELYVAATYIITKSEIYILVIIISHFFIDPNSNSNTHIHSSSHTMVLENPNVYQSNLSQPDVCFKITTHNQ